MKHEQKTILFGIGNYGREDDGLGWVFLDRIKDLLPDSFDIEYRYQLQVEDAEQASHYDRIVFIDAHMGVFEKGFLWEECKSKPSDAYTSHELNPESILFLTDSIYNKKPEAFILGITGESYELAIGLTQTAELNLNQSLAFFEKEILELVN